MCEAHEHCCECALCKEQIADSYDSCFMDCANHAVESEILIKEWAANHPIITNRDKYYKTFGYHENMGKKCHEPFCISSYCNECSKWWDAEYKEPKEDVKGNE